MAPSPQEDGWGNNVFALGGFTVENLGGGKAIWGKMLFFSLRWEEGGVTRGLVVSIHIKENVPVVNINFLHMAWNFKGKLIHLL